MYILLPFLQVGGGSNLSIKVSWSQKLICDAGQFSISIPFDFPDYVTPAGKKIAKREKIQLNVNSGTSAEVLCKATSHPLKVTQLLQKYFSLNSVNRNYIN